MAKDKAEHTKTMRMIEHGQIDIYKIIKKKPE